MKKEKIKKISQKIIISICLAFMMFTFIAPTYSHAADGDIIGGILLDPICNFIAVLGDGVNYLVSAVSGASTNPYARGREKIFMMKNYEEDMNNGSDSDNDLYVKNLKVNIDIDGTFGLPNIKITPETIFKNKVALLDANFFDTRSDSDYGQDMIGGTKLSTARQLKTIISNWYNAFRLVAIVGLLTVLIYLGIRITISSVAEEQAKYKERLIDWLVAFCLVFFLHYIMVFTTTIVQEVLNIMGGNNDKQFNSLYIQVTDTTGGIAYMGNQGETVLAADLGSTDIGSFVETNGIIETGRIAIGQAKANFGQAVSNIASWVTGDDSYSDGAAIMNNEAGYGDEHVYIPIQFPTNLTGYIRILVNSVRGTNKLAYTIMYLAMSFYTAYFFFIYIKRLVVLTFLTVIAPLVALTYPIDKVKDGKAQAFSFWLREYLINSMLPIIHLIIYTVLVSSAMELATTAPIYAIAVLAFIVPAEKIIRKMFGIRSEMAPPPGGFATGALAVTALNAVKNRIGSGGKKSGGKDGGKGSGSDGGKDNVRMSDTTGSDFDEDVGGGSGAGSGSGSGSGGAPTRTRADQLRHAREELNTARDMRGEAWKDFRNAKGFKGKKNALGSLFAGQKLVTEASRNRRKIHHPRLYKASSVDLSRERNFARMIRRRYNIPKGKALSTLAKRGLKKGAKIAVRGATTLTGASIGLSAGIVSGDLSDVWKGATLGAGAGLAIGGFADKTIDTGYQRLSDAAFEIEQGAKAAENRKAEREFISNMENVKYMEEKHENMSGREIQKRLKEMAKYQAIGDKASIKEIEKTYEIEQKAFAQNVTAGMDDKTARSKAQKYAMQAGKHRNVFGDVANDKEKYDKAFKSLTEKKGLSSAQARKFLGDISTYHKV